MTRLCVLMLVIFSACGVPTFPGTYSGTASAVLQCPDSGFGGAADFTAIWTIGQTGNDLTINVTGGSCNPVRATVDSQAPDSASIARRVCPPLADPFGGFATDEMLSGDMALDAQGDLTFFIRTLTTFRDPGIPDESCPQAGFGLLKRQR